MRGAVAIVFGLGLAACGSNGAVAPSTDAAPIVEDFPGVPIEGLRLGEVALFQVVKVPLARDGEPVHSTVPIVSDRAALLRLSVTPDVGWQKRNVVARVKITFSREGRDESRIFETERDVEAASTEADLESTLNIELPREVMMPGARVGVLLQDPARNEARTPGDNAARFPRDGTLAPLGVRKEKATRHVRLLPVRYDTDGSGRLPDTSDAQLARYRDALAAMYPLSDVVVTVHTTLPWSKPLRGNVDDLVPLLLEAIKVRDADAPTPDLYYYALFAPSAALGGYCQSGNTCTLGSTGIGLPVSVGIGYSGEQSVGTFIHEIGHGHGLKHAPCATTFDVDANFPQADGSIGTWGYDSQAKRLLEPSSYADVMGYCAPRWISAYHYAALFETIAKSAQP